MVSFLGRLLGWQVEIPPEERETILAYLTEEVKLAAFQDLEAGRYNDAATKYGGDVRPGGSQVSALLPAARRLLKAADELVGRHSGLGPVPDVAAGAYFTWQKTYMQYQEWVSGVVSVYEGLEAGILPDVGRVQHLLVESEKTRKVAESEEAKLMRRLKLRAEDWRVFVQEAQTAAKAERWEPN